MRAAEEAHDKHEQQRQGSKKLKGQYGTKETSGCGWPAVTCASVLLRFALTAYYHNVGYRAANPLPVVTMATRGDPLGDIVRKLNGSAEAALEVQLPQGGEHHVSLGLHRGGGQGEH